MGWDKYNKDIRQNVHFNYKQTTDFKIRRFLCKNKFLKSESQNGGCLVGVEATPTHSTSPVNKGTPSIFHTFLVGDDEKFLEKRLFLLSYSNFLLSLHSNWWTQGIENSEIYIKNAAMRANRAPRERAFQRATVASESRCGQTPKTHDSSEIVDFLMCPVMAYRDFSFLHQQVLLLVVRPIQR